jgi:hypothetical protein
MTYDPLRQQVFLFGGLSDCGAGRADTWTWDGSAWMNALATQPGSHREPRAWFNPIAGYVCLFGGFDGDYLNDMWGWMNGAWSEIAQQGPAGRAGHGLSYDEQSLRVVLFGGRNNNGPLSDTQLFDGVNWAPSEGPGPSARSGHAMAYDAARGQVVLFGGANGPDMFDDTWIWSVRPVITSNPVPLGGCANGSASFSVRADGNGPFTYQWRKDGLPLANGGQRVVGADTPDLNITRVAGVDGGMYDCVVSNGCGTTLSTGAVLSVCAPDLDCDGAINSGDFFAFLVFFFSGTPSADFNADNTITSQDFFDFLTAFFAGCP